MLANTPVSLTQFADYITQSEVMVAKGNIDAEGKFSLSVKDGPTGEYMLHVGNSAHSLILEPGHIYNLEIPDPTGEQVYYPIETDTTLLLYQISNLDYEVNYFSIYNYEDFSNGRIKNKLKKFIDSMDVKYKSITNPYFTQYKEYKMAVLMSTAHYKSRNTMYQTFLKNKPILYNHPQYMAFFNSFYTGVMNGLYKSGRYPGLKNAFLDGTSIDSVLTAIQKEETGGDKDLTELVCMKGLFEIYYNPEFNKTNVEKLAIELKEKTVNQQIKDIVSYFLMITGRLKPGNPAANFEGKDTEGNVHQLSEYQGKYIYLTFFSTDDAASIREVTAIKSLYDDYRKEVTFISVCSSCTYSSLQAFIAENKLKWTFLIIDPAAESAYEVITYPTAFLIDKEGKFAYSPYYLPSAGASKRLFVYLKEQRLKNR